MDLMELLTPHYEENETMKELQSIIGREVEKIATNKDIAINQGFVETATILLSRWEKIFGLEIDVSKSNEFRRERIKAKIRGQGTTTKQMIVDVASSFSNGEVEVIEDFPNYKFKIKFVGVKGIPANLTDLTITINEIKPAHLSFEYEFTFVTWNEFDSYNKTWNEWDGLNLTWDELETYKE